MKGISEVIAIILILMITISIAGLAYTFMSSTMASTTSAASSAVDTTTSSMLTSFIIESIDGNKVYIRNTGHSTIYNLTVYVNDIPVSYSSSSSISPGSIGNVNISDVIIRGDKIRITAPSGFSTESPATIDYYGAVGYWKFDEGLGSIASDQSGNGNNGSLVGMNNSGNNLNGTTPSGWTIGKYGNGLGFDGSNDYVNILDSTTLHYTEFTSCAWFRVNSVGDGYGGIVGRNRPNILRLNSLDLGSYVYNSDSIYNGKSWDVNLLLGEWYHACLSFKRPVISLYFNGALFEISAFDYDLMSSFSSIQVGVMWNHYFNGTIDEVAIWNRTLSIHEIEKIYKSIY